MPIDEVMSSRVSTSDKKIFTCLECGKNITSTFNLNRHKKPHLGEKLHTCDVCLKAFARNSDLVRHIKIHNAGEPSTLKCDECDKVLHERII